jgi:hypothetical protein
MTFSDTPRTDEWVFKHLDGTSSDIVDASFARQLECDLNAAHESINAVLRGDASCAVLIERIEELKYQNAKLLDAGKHLAKCDYQSGCIKVPCPQCDAALAVIKQNEPI